MKSLSYYQELIGKNVIYRNRRKFKQGVLEKVDVTVDEVGQTFQFRIEGRRGSFDGVYTSKREALMENLESVLDDGRLFDGDIPDRYEYVQINAAPEGIDGVISAKNYTPGAAIMDGSKQTEEDFDSLMRGLYPDGVNDTEPGNPKDMESPVQHDPASDEGEDEEVDEKAWVAEEEEHGSNPAEDNEFSDDDLIG